MQITICLSALHDEWHASPLERPMCAILTRDRDSLRCRNQPLTSLHRLLLRLLCLCRCLVKYDVCVHVLAV